MRGSVALSAPAPGQILAVGRSYAAHAEELGNVARTDAPLLFWKPIGCLAAGGECPLPRWPEGPTRVDYEGEVALLLGRDLGPGTPPLDGDPWDAVAGVAAAVDVSDRTLQKLEPQWVRAKGFAGACAIGDVAPRPTDPAGITLRTFKNGEQVQEGDTGLLLFPFRQLLRYLHGFLRLDAGDAILTGTPAGVGPVGAGDTVRVVVSTRDAVVAEVALRFVRGPDVPAFSPS